MFTLSFLLFGALLGVRHALEPDHLAAVSTLVTDQRSARSASTLGALWGLGHTAALVAVASVLAALGSQMPPRAATAFELGVAVMLVFLGVRSLVRAARPALVVPGVPHHHGGRLHHHAAPPDGHVHLGRWVFARRSFLVGLMHGLAGSGSVVALVAAELSSPWLRLCYVALFGLGSVAGMAALSGLVGWPVARWLSGPRTARALSFASGSVAIGIGLFWAWTTLTAS
jgi:ABC-type nickel/cobalt efflux system permease component RcnA